MAEACAARVVALERPAAGFARSDVGQTAASNAVKNTWLGHVAARVVASSLGKARLSWLGKACRFHTSGGPRRLSQGRGRRIMIFNNIYTWRVPRIGGPVNHPC